MEYRVAEEVVRLVDRSPEQLGFLSELLGPLVKVAVGEDGVQFGDELGGVGGPGRPTERASGGQCRKGSMPTSQKRRPQPAR